MSGVAARALAAHDRGEAPGRRAVWRLLGSGGLEGAKESLRTPQGARREGMYVCDDLKMFLTLV